MIFLAYDGSINGDWVANYAIRFAARTREKTLTLLYASDKERSPALVDDGIHRIEWKCEIAGVTLDVSKFEGQRKVHQRILEAIPSGDHHTLVCGTRAGGAAERRGLLAGTVSEKLLNAPPCHVVALRVLQPGVLGAPHDVLIPLSGHPRGIDQALPLLHLMDLEDIKILRVMEVSRRRFKHLSSDGIRGKQADGRDYLDKALTALRRELRPALNHLRLEGNVVISDDWAKEVIIYANQVRVRLLLLGASERPVSHFFFGNPIEQILRSSPCDVAVYRGPEG